MTTTALHPNVTIDYQIVDHDSLQQKLIDRWPRPIPCQTCSGGMVTLIIDACNKTQSVLDLTPYYR